MSKPTNKPGWNPTSNSTEPSSTKKAAGWSSGEKPSSAHFNWLFKTVSEWIDHIDAEGVQGPKGDTGPQGSQGLKGDTGATGPQGLQGDKGDTGATGAQGIQGAKGDTGAQGIQGLKGDTGATGPQGLKGDTGPQGATGASGSISSADLARIAALEAVSGVVAASPVTVTFPYNGGAAPSEYSIGNSGSSIAVNWTNGASQFVTLTADATISFTGATAGNTYYLRIQQGGYGLKRVVGWPTNIVWNGGSVPTISTAAWTVDVIGCYYDGTNYYGYVSQGYFTAPSVIDTKKGYVTGGASGGASGGTAINTVERVNFNADETFVVVQNQFDVETSATGSLVSPYVGALNRYSCGTQSATYGYKTSYYTTALPTVSGQSSSAIQKLAFANETTKIQSIRAVTSAWWGSDAYSFTRKALIQSNANAYGLNWGTQGTKLNFAADTTSDYTITLLNGAFNLDSGNVQNYSFSSTDWGTRWSLRASTTSNHKLIFSTDSSVTNTAFYTPNVNNNMNEAVDGYYNGYITTCTAVSGVGSLYKTDKSNECWETLSNSLTENRSGATATQGNIAGYFCGGQKTTGASLTTLASSLVSKIQFSPQTLSVHSASLATARQFGAGFEG